MPLTGNTPTTFGTSKAGCSASSAAMWPPAEWPESTMRDGSPGEVRCAFHDRAQGSRTILDEDRITMRRGEAIGGHHENAACLHHARSHEAAPFLVAGDPAATMQEHQHGARGRTFDICGPVPVEDLPIRFTPADITPHRNRRHGLGRGGQCGFRVGLRGRHREGPLLAKREAVPVNDSCRHERLNRFAPSRRALPRGRGARVPA